MQKESNDQNINRLVTPILIGCILLWTGYEWGKSNGSNTYNPRNAINGIDTIYHNDSIYKVQINIDQVLPVEKLNDPDERN